MKRISQLKKPDYLEGARLALNNAEDHLMLSQKAAEEHKYGIAVSMLITSSEELIKASILRLKSIDNTLRIDKFDNYFRSHSQKHEAFFKVLLKNNANSIESASKDDQLSISMIIGIMILSYAFSEKQKDSKKSNFEKVFEWDQRRTSGLYVSFNREEEKWETPSGIYSREDFNDYDEFIRNGFKELKNICFSGRYSENEILNYFDTIAKKAIQK